VILWLDLETFNLRPIASGTNAYAESAEIIVAAYAVDDGPVTVLDIANGDDRSEFLQLLQDPTVTLCAHNSYFDRTVLRHAWGLELDINRWTDTMVQAMVHSLPAALATLCDVLGVESDQTKDARGKLLIQRFCKPQAKNTKLRRATKQTHPAEWAEFLEYARLDIEAMRAVSKKLPSWNLAVEMPLWRLDQAINDRGVCIDVTFATAALAAVELEKTRLSIQAAEMTDGAVQAATQRDAVLKHALSKYGYTLPDMRASTIEARVEDPDMPPGLRELLLVRLSASTASTAKYKKLLAGVSVDGRLRGTLQFCGALRTGRWAGRLFQPQNLPRPSLDNDEIEQGIDIIKSGSADLVVKDVMRLASSALRGVIVAPAGKKLVIADLSNIEGRMLAWAAGEAWKCDAFAQFDVGTGHDVYRLAYARTFGIDAGDVTKDQRQLGKVLELALGYSGGLGAFNTFATAFGIDLEDLAKRAAPALDPEVLARSHIWREKARDTMPDFGLTDFAWTTIDAIKTSWRIAHPETVGYWKAVEHAVVDAINNPDEIFRTHGLAIRKEGVWLRIRMQSGRSLCYPLAQITEDGTIRYRGVNQFSRAFGWIKTYSGKLVENIIQALARDLLASSMPAIEAAGYSIVLTVHDEIIAEAPDSAEFSAKHLAHLMSTQPAWAKGLPLAAAGFETYRYRKE
jgi:DNA polymerase